MKLIDLNSLLRQSGFKKDLSTGVWSTGEHSFNYSDGDLAENYLLESIRNAQDVSMASVELASRIHDWSSLYHLSHRRANLLKPFGVWFEGKRVLEIGCGCGAISRFLGESGAEVVSVEGSLRRATIARARCKDLDNVEVICSSSNILPDLGEFDAVLLIGVLEYARCFLGNNGQAILLQNCHERLKEQGHIFVAIENKLGIKYFAGAPEDHIGTPMHGINSAYTAESVATFGRVELKELLGHAGFKTIDEYLPLPDYKFPSSIVTPLGWQKYSDELSNLALESAYNDQQGIAYPTFSIEQGIKNTWVNGLAADLSNSFMMIGSKNENIALNEGVAAYHYSDTRVLKYQKYLMIREKNDGDLMVSSEYLFPELLSISYDSSLNHSLQKEVDFIQGSSLFYKLIKIINEEQWSSKEIASWIQEWLSVLVSKAGILGDYNDETKISGNYIDAMPFNAIQTPKGEIILFDLEWQLQNEIELGYVVYRALFLSLFRVTSVAKPKEGTPLNILELILLVMSHIGFSVSDEKPKSYITAEIKLYKSINPDFDEDSWSKQIRSKSFYSRIPLREQQLHILNQQNWIDNQQNEIFDITKHVEKLQDDLKQCAFVCDKQFVEINSQQINIAQHEMNIVTKEKKIEEQRQEWARLCNQVDYLAKELQSVYGSNSWKITKPLRLLFTVLRKIKKLGRLIWKGIEQKGSTIKFLKDSFNIIRLHGFEHYLDQLRVGFVERNNCLFEDEREPIASNIFVNNEKRILFIVHAAHQGGATFLSLDMIKRLRTVYGYYVASIVVVNGVNLHLFEQESDFCYCLNQSSFSKLENRKDINSVLCRLHDDLNINKCIVNSVTGGVLGGLLAAHGFETVTLVHEMSNSIHQNAYSYAAEVASLYSNHMVFPAEYVKKNFLDSFDIQTSSIHVQPQGLYSKISKDISRNKAHEIVCRELNIDSDSKLVLGVGYGDWRKGVDLFVGTAEKVVSIDSKVHFLWIGDFDPSVLDIASIVEINPNIHWMNFTKDLAIYYASASIFFLSSREDPFPSVVLEALYFEVPVTCFKESGGIEAICDALNLPSIVHGDTDEACRVIIDMLECESSALSYNKNYSEYVAKYHDQSKYILYILSLFGRGRDSNRDNLPKVSVIIPNYNYANFLKERIESVLYQTVSPSEIIFLDDNSQDNSVCVAEQILNKFDIPYHVITNKENKGCFLQWKKGLELAKHEIIWIAEADDVAEHDFLETLLVEFVESNVNLAYCQSMIIDENSIVHSHDYHSFTDGFSQSKWKKNYKLDGVLEVIENLGIKNTIPNASAVLMRKSALFGIQFENFQICGDWYAYLYALREGQISFIAQSLNKHRRHSKSIVNRLEKSMLYFEELIKIKRVILDFFALKKNMKKEFLDVIPSEYGRLGCEGYGHNMSENELISNKYQELNTYFDLSASQYPYQTITKNILFVMPDLEVGGGQILVIRIANFLSRYQKVHLYVTRPYLFDKNINEMISDRVNLVLATDDFNVLSDYIEKNKIDVINSHIWWSDKVTYLALNQLKHLNINWVISMHGCYEALLHSPDWDPDFKTMVHSIFERANHVIYATSKNTPIFDFVNYPIDKTSKIYYGYEKQNLTAIDRDSNGIEHDAFIFGMVARGIEEKGWRELISAFIALTELTDKKVYLVLVGSGTFFELMRSNYLHIKNIKFVSDASKNSEWIRWVKLFNVGVLPTYFISESLPNTIIEYLAYSKPVISTDIGDIKYMINDDSKQLSAGIVLELKDGKVCVEDLKNAMLEFLTKDLSLYIKDSSEIFNEKFEMQQFVSSYFSLFCLDD